MRNEKDQLLVDEVKQKLDWYINEASDEEYDEQAVASLQYLLDTLEPTGEEVDTEAAFEQFKEYVADRDAKEGNAKRKPFASRAVKSEKGTIMFRYKGMVAAVLLLLVLAVSLGTQAEAIKDEGFFHWFQRVVSGREFVTSPGDLDASTETVDVLRVENREEVPIKWKDWCKLEADIMSTEEFAWSHMECFTFDVRDCARSFYKYDKEEIILGIDAYGGKVGYFKQEFFDSDSCQTVNIAGEEFEFFNRINIDGKILSGLEFYRNNYKYYVWGYEESVDKLQEIVVKYKKAVEKSDL